MSQKDDLVSALKEAMKESQPAPPQQNVFGKNNTFISVGLVAIIVIVTIWINGNMTELRVNHTSHTTDPSLHHSIRAFVQDNYASKGSLDFLNERVAELKMQLELVNEKLDTLLRQ